MRRSTPFIQFKQFSGINNQKDPLELSASDLTKATNVDIDDTRYLERRGGSGLELSGNYRDIDPEGSGLVIKDDTNLHALMLDSGQLSSVLVKPGLTPGARAVYQNVNGIVNYFTNAHEIGFVGPDLEWHDLPEVDAGVSSPAVAESMRQTRMKMPPGHLMDFYNGRLYTASDHIYFSDSMALHRCHNEQGFFMTAGSPTLLKSVADGIWFADGNIWFASGADIMDSTKIKKANYDAILGAATIVQGSHLGIPGITGDCVVFWTTHGCCLGCAGGQFINLTENGYIAPDQYASGTSMYRHRPGISQVVTIMNN